MNKLLNHLEKITNFSEGKKDPRNSLTKCKKCILKNSEYAVCFYRRRLNSTCLTSSQQATTSATRVKIMFISRDPNTDPCIFQLSRNLAKFIVTCWRNPKKQNIQRFFYDFLWNNNAWRQFINYLQDTSNNNLIPKFYWTHLVKCYAQNNPSLVKKAAKFCIEYLREEIRCIDPVLIIAAGADVGREVYNLKEISLLRPIRGFFNNSVVHQMNKQAITQQEGIVVIPHPSGRSKYYDAWEKGNFQIGITFNELKDLVNKLIK